MKGLMAYLLFVCLFLNNSRTSNGNNGGCLRSERFIFLLKTRFRFLFLDLYAYVWHTKRVLHLSNDGLSLFPTPT